jgi:hypothetical protein
MILTKQQADLIGVLLSNDDLVIGRKKNVGRRVVFNVNTGIAELEVKKKKDSEDELVTVHGRVINDMTARGLLKQDDDDNYRLTDLSRAINKEDLLNFTFGRITRVTDKGICDMADKYGYGFEFQRLVGIAMFTKKGVIVPETSIDIARISDKSVTEWEEHLLSSIKKI